ncbi:MAG: lipoprotein, partial [Bacteroides acidifaciens]|nr:lipoprotein [Bacteroides acidifaciens]
MKKILFPLVAILLLAACSSSEDTINEPEPPKYEINSVILVGDLKLQSYIFEGDYYIEAIDESGNKVFTIKDKAENYTHDLGFGDKREYIVKGCFLQSALKKDDCFYILGDLYSSELVAHPHKFILKIKDGKLVLKKYFD